MNTGIRRFILRLVVGLLTFIIGVAVAMALGGFRPFQGFTSSPNNIYRSGHCSRTSSESSDFYYEYGEHGCKRRARYQTTELPPPPPPPAPPMTDAPPLPPPPPRHGS